MQIGPSSCSTTCHAMRVRLTGMLVGLARRNDDSAWLKDVEKLHGRGVCAPVVAQLHEIDWPIDPLGQRKLFFP